MLSRYKGVGCVRFELCSSLDSVLQLEFFFSLDSIV